MIGEQLFFESEMTKPQKQSAGLLMFRRTRSEIEVFLVHPGGPYWAKKNEGSWTLPKGVFETGESPLQAAQREFREETGFDVDEPFFELGYVRQNGGKIVHAWAFQGNCDPIKLTSNTCEIEWPPRCGRHIVIPEVDRGAWFSLLQAAIFLRQEQQPFLDRLQDLVKDQK